jgi:hypothetical protein
VSQTCGDFAVENVRDGYEPRSQNRQGSTTDEH